MRDGLLTRLWLDRRSGPAARTVLAFAALYLAIQVLLRNRVPPAGELVFGALIGVLYALVAFGLILVYRASGIINFAQAEMGAASAVLAVVLIKGYHLPYALGLGVAVGSAALAGALVELIVVRRFANAPRLIPSVATVGVSLLFAVLQFFLPRWLGSRTIDPAPARTPFSGLHFTIAPLTFDANALLILVVAGLVMLGLTLFFRLTDVGIAVRASAENRDRARLLGIPVHAVSTVVWVLAAVLSALGVFLRIPVVGLPISADVGPSVLLYALAAAVVARMESFSVALAAGIAIGVTEQSLYYFSHDPSIASAVMLPVLLVAMLVQRGRLSRGRETADTARSLSRQYRPVPPELTHLPEVRWGRAALGAAALALAVGLPHLVSFEQQILASVVVIYGIVAVSLVILTGWAGQISLGQWGLAGVGAFVTSELALHLHADFFLTLVVAGLAGALAAVVIGLPALRIQGLYLAVTTLAFGVAVQVYLLSPDYFRSVLPSGLELIRRPRLYGHYSIDGPRAFYYLCLAVLGLALVSARGLRRSRSGRAMIAARDNGRAAQSYGISVPRIRLAAFAVSGFWAGLAGCLFAFHQQAVQPASFDPGISILLLLIVVIGGVSSLPGALLGALFIGVLKYGGFSSTIQAFASGVGVLVLLWVVPGGLAQVFYDTRDRVLREIARRRRLVVPSLVADVGAGPDVATPASGEVALASGARPAVPPVITPPAAPEGALLRCSALDVGYDGVQVLFGVDFEVAEGEIVALLGTNGAGKSTLLRAISGLRAPGSGRIWFAGRDVTGSRPEMATRHGIIQMPGGRSVFPSLTVKESLRLAGWMFRRKDPRHVEAATARALGYFPALAGKGDTPAGDLSGGEQQMLGLAMALILKPRLLMIDELALGLAPKVVGELVEIVRAIRAEGTAVVVVEQSVNVAMTVADRAVFMEKGEVRFGGPTAQLLDRPDVLHSVFLEGAAVAMGRTAGAGAKKAAAATRARPSLRTRIAEPPAPNGDGAPGDGHDGSGRGSAGVVLAAQKLSVRYGGVHALEGVSFELPANSITGVIGPNGAGKTTLFDAISGFAPLGGGGLRLLGKDITTWTPGRRARAGLGRSFQDGRLVPSLTVAENIALAFERHLSVRDPVAASLLLAAVARENVEIGLAVDELIDTLGLSAFANKFASELSTGSRRIVDLAMLLAHRPVVLLLDEPSTGIAQREAEALGPLLVRIRDDLGCAMLVIEHDMPLISSISERMIALELGQVIATGAPDEVIRHPDVVASYLGTTDAVISRSGPGRAGRRSPARRRPRPAPV